MSQESFAELARLALRRNGMERLWRSNKVTSLYELCARAIVGRTTVYGIDRLPLPASVRQTLRSFALTSPSLPASSQLLRPGAHYKSIKSKRAGGGGRTQVVIPADAVGPRCGRQKGSLPRGSACRGYFLLLFAKFWPKRPEN